MRIPRVLELTRPPVVGERYRVPCILAPIVAGTPPRWLPVLGPEHDDVEIIGFKYHHWHRDYRFMSDRQIRLCRGDCDVADREFLHVTFAAGARVVERIRRCRRPAGVFPIDVPLCDEETRISNTWLPRLEDAYAGHTLKDCRVCPHRGIPLNSMPADERGVVVCPGHGLAWDVATGKLARRTPSHSGPSTQPSAPEGAP
jgi:hypothetical protein